MQEHRIDRWAAARDGNLTEQNCLHDRSQALERVDSELRAFRGDASRQLQAAGERESALRAILQQIYNSSSWRLLSRYWRLKARLLGR